MAGKIKCFQDAVSTLGPYTTLDSGLRVVEVAKITGSVGKCGELDRRFQTLRRRDRGERYRRSQFTQRVMIYEFLPPIQCYLLQGEYFVIDGHRRTAAAKSFGLEYLDAYVQEVLPQRDREARQGMISRRRFELETDLMNIRLGRESGYAALLEEVNRYRAGMGRTARDWHSQVYLPACSAIRSSTLKQVYPDLRTGDIFVLILNFYRDLMNDLPDEFDFEDLISGYLFARKIRRLKRLRRLPYRVLTLVMGGGNQRRRGG